MTQLDFKRAHVPAWMNLYEVQIHLKTKRSNFHFKESLLSTSKSYSREEWMWGWQRSSICLKWRSKSWIWNSSSTDVSVTVKKDYLKVWLLLVGNIQHNESRAALLLSKLSFSWTKGPDTPIWQQRTDTDGPRLLRRLESLRLGHVSYWNTPQRLQPTAKKHVRTAHAWVAILSLPAGGGSVYSSFKRGNNRKTDCVITERRRTDCVI